MSTGAAITLPAEGNADIYSREGIVCIPVSGLEPTRLVIAWRRSGRRPAVRDGTRRVSVRITFSDCGWFAVSAQLAA